MTVPLGVRVCQVTGCSRAVIVSPAGVHYSRCLAHTSALLTGAFGTPRTTPAPSAAVPPVAAFGGAVVRPNPAA